LALSVNAYFNWTLPQILLIGFILTLSSTAVVLMVLQGLCQSRIHAGQLTVGVLVAQDIAVVPMLVFAQSGIDVLQQWPLLLVRVVIALVILAALLVWIGACPHKFTQDPSWMGAFNHWRRAGGTGACVIACHPTNRRIQLCFDSKRGRIGHFCKF
jgi:hypothetical protein